MSEKIVYELAWQDMNVLDSRSHHEAVVAADFEEALAKALKRHKIPEGPDTRLSITHPDTGDWIEVEDGEWLYTHEGPGDPKLEKLKKNVEKNRRALRFSQEALAEHTREASWMQPRS